MGYKFGTRTITNLVGVYPDFVDVLSVAIRKSTVDFGIPDAALRTTKQQQYLYASGRTRPGLVITQKDGVRSKSNHQAHADGYGHAVDCIPYVGGRYVFTEDAWDYYHLIASAISYAAKELKVAENITWGCAWGMPMSSYPSDPEHMLKQREIYKQVHVGKDFLDGPHFQWV